MKKFFFLFCVLFLLGKAGSTTIDVPGDEATIQEAIDSATLGDTVLVQPDTYMESINFKGKNIVVGSLFLTTGDTSYISQTVINGGCDKSIWARNRMV